MTTQLTKGLSHIKIETKFLFLGNSKSDYCHLMQRINLNSIIYIPKSITLFE